MGRLHTRVTTDAFDPNFCEPHGRLKRFMEEAMESDSGAKGDLWTRECLIDVVTDLHRRLCRRRRCVTVRPKTLARS
jgi:hypothetical protein